MSLLSLFRAPQLPDAQASRAAAVLAPLLTILAGAAALTSVAGLTLDWALPWQAAGMFGATAIFVWARRQVHRGNVGRAAALTTTLLFMISVSSMLADQTPAAYPGAFALAVGIGGITLRRPDPLWLGSLSAAAVLATDVAQRQHWITLRRPTEEAAVAVMQALSLVVLGAAIHWANQALARAQARAAEQEARAQNLQHSLFRSQRMEAIGRLAGGIAHDFNNLLTVVSANAAFVADAPESSDETREACEAIVKAAEGGSNLTRQLLAFGGRQVVRPEVVDVADVVLDFRSVLAHMGDKDKTELRVDAPAGLGQVRVDPGQLQHAIANLVVNAAHASERGGTITVRVRSLELDAARELSHGTAAPGPYVCIDVEDDGAGMDGDTVAQAFEPFFTTRGRGGGSGLGLAVVHGVVTRNEGHVSILSEPGRGTTVSMWLPRVDAAASWAPRTRSQATSDALSGISVLLVDDTAGARQAVRRQLEQAGAVVHEAADAARALAVLDAEPTISAAVIDVMMPGVSGPALVSQMRDRGFSAPVVFLTGYAEPDGFAGRDTAGIPVLYKPAGTADLVQALNSQLDAAAAS